MTSLVPSDDMLLKEIRRIQAKQGSEIGIQKIWDYIKAEHPLWSFGLKRLREIRKKSSLAPSPGSGSAPVPVPPACKPEPASPETPPPGMVILNLNVIVALRSGRRTFLFKEPIPIEFTEPGAPRQITSVFLTNLIEKREAELVQANAWSCLYCNKPAEECYGIPSVVLTEKPPTIFNMTQPLCSMRSACAREAYGRMQAGLVSPDFPGGDVYHVPA
ncbi:hypothetical protein Hypma_008833 [Hypsizygus marmoreus]|uniref:Uncharacterized protein n=1 Tax=Hypsizygus marmoreus TaxID=39966 RepID=A0A369JP30_HYPMA|nr:hypothetical protein Hypma_008833 [Hypsizygus marmoreus]